MLNFLNVDDFTKNLEPVTSTEFYLRSGELNPDGLFSEEIFGGEGSKDRAQLFSYINLNATVIHPAAYRIILRLDRKVEKILSTEENFIIDNKGLIEFDQSGESGIDSFVKAFPKIKFRGETPIRDKFIKLLDYYNKHNELFIDRLPVIPPDFRPIFEDEEGTLIIDQLNEVYIGIIRKSFQIKAAPSSGPLFDLLNFGVQKAILDHDDFIRTKIQKKTGIVRSAIMGKRVDFSGRAVITPGPDLEVDDIGVPLRMAVKLFEPFVMHNLLYTNRFDKEELNREVKDYLGVELSVGTIQRIIKGIKEGDKIPDSLIKIMFEATELAMEGRVILAKRDPVLHAGSYRAFYPKLVMGNTVQLSTMVVGGFNADFDGDCNFSMISICYKNKLKTIHISNLDKEIKFKEIKKSEKSNGTIITNYKPLEDITIQSIDVNNGEISHRKIVDYSKHENIKMYQVHDPKNRFEDFWTSYDHSLIIYDEIKKEIRKISPRELIEEPNGKFLIQKKEKN